MTHHNAHLDPELLSAYLDEEVGAEERALVEAHLPGCAACQRELEALRYTVSLFQRLPEVPLPRTFYVTAAMVEPAPARRAGWRGWLRSLAPVGLAIAALLLVMVVVRPPGASAPQADTAMESGAVPAAPAEMESAAGAAAAEEPVTLSAAPAAEMPAAATEPYPAPEAAADMADGGAPDAPYPPPAEGETLELARATEVTPLPEIAAGESASLPTDTLAFDEDVTSAPLPPTTERRPIQWLAALLLALLLVGFFLWRRPR